MNTPFLKIAALSLAGLMGVSCTTTYDEQGRAVETVTPEGAVLGAAAVGLIGYSIAKNRHKKKHHGYYGHDYGYHGGNYGHGNHGYGHRGYGRRGR